MSKIPNGDKKLPVVLAGSLLLGMVALNGGLLQQESGAPRISYAAPAPVSENHDQNKNAPSGIDPKPDQPALVGDQDDWQAVVSKVTPSVVSIRVSSPDGSGGVGSGVILDKQGYIVTNNHVVSQAQGSVISVVFVDSTVISARVVRTDATSDLAVIKLNQVPDNLVPITFASSKNLMVGSPVLAVGSPLGLSGTVTDGIVSAMNRPVTSKDAGTSADAGTVISAIQTNAAINPGNSGGALVNARGELVGINSSIATTGLSNGNIGIGFAIPSDTVSTIVGYLRHEQDFPYGKLGVQVTPGIGQEGNHGILGAEIKMVLNGSGAERAGLRRGDVIVAVGDEPVASNDALLATIHKYPKGKPVKVTFVRGRQEREATVTLQ